MSLLSSSYEEYKQKIKVIIKEQLDFVNGECSSPETPENLISGEETSGINSFEKEDIVKEEKSNVIEEISAEPDITAEVENDAEIEAASESDNIINATDAKSSDNTIEEKQNFIWQSVEEDDDIKDKEIDAENDTVSDIKENEAVENINKSEVLKSEDKKQTGIEEIKYETEPKNEADNAEDDIIVENIMMKTPTINDAKEDISHRTSRHPLLFSCSPLQFLSWKSFTKMNGIYRAYPGLHFQEKGSLISIFRPVLDIIMGLAEKIAKTYENFRNRI